jgi:single-strand DNA-binding protein
MASVNKIILLGNVGKDPEMRYLASGMALCSTSLATSTRRKDKTTGEMVEETQWHRLNFFDKLAEVAGQYVKKGGQIYVEGRLKYGEYTDKDGVKRQTTDVLVSEMQLLGGRDQGGAKPSVPSRPKPATKPANSGFDDMADDIPFN